MTPTEGDHDGPSPRIAGAIDGDLHSCWMCGKAVNVRAFFCHACGSIQPPHDIDHFKRLGLERRFDLELDRLDHQRQGLAKALAPPRFETRGQRQRDFARQQIEALEAAYAVLRNPVRRARYLLELEGIVPPIEAEPDPLATEVDNVADVALCDRLGAQVASEVAACVSGLAQTFRRGALTEAARALSRLERLEAVATQIRARRAGLPPPAG